MEIIENHMRARKLATAILALREADPVPEDPAPDATIEAIRTESIRLARRIADAVDPDEIRAIAAGLDVSTLGDAERYCTLNFGDGLLFREYMQALMGPVTVNTQIILDIIKADDVDELEVNETLRFIGPLIDDKTFDELFQWCWGVIVNNTDDDCEDMRIAAIIHDMLDEDKLFDRVKVYTDEMMAGYRGPDFTQYAYKYVEHARFNLWLLDPKFGINRYDYPSMVWFYRHRHRYSRIVDAVKRDERDSPLVKSACKL